MSLTENAQESSYLAYIVSIDHNVLHVFGHAEIMSILHTVCNHSTITTLFQTYLLTLSQINFKNDLFHYFSALKITTWNPGYSISLRGEKNTIRSINFLFYLI